MDKLPVCYGDGVSPYCPHCGSGEYLHNEDGNENEFCGQCGCPLDWSQMYNEDADRIEEKHKCGDCVEYLRSKYKHTTGLCKAKGVYVVQSKPACKKHFKIRECEVDKIRGESTSNTELIRSLYKVGWK